VKFILIPGTHAWKNDPAQWWHPESRFLDRVEAQGGVIFNRRNPFAWSTDLDGLLTSRGHSDWRAGAAALRFYIGHPECSQLAGRDTGVLAHSHGGQVALYAAAAGLKIGLLVTIATPVRKDMREVIEAARPNISYWRHLHSGMKDWTQLFGGLGDGGFSFTRHFEGADENIKIGEAGHSGLLKDERYWDFWTPHGFGWLRPDLGVTR
jgi:hypothetical protein